MTKSDIVQRLVSGKLTQNEKRGYSEEGLKHSSENPEPAEPRKVSFALSKDDKIAIYQDVKLRVIDGATPDDIGKAVVACIDEFLKEKENEAYGQTAPNKGVIRRVE